LKDRLKKIIERSIRRIKENSDMFLRLILGLSIGIGLNMLLEPKFYYKNKYMYVLIVLYLIGILIYYYQDIRREKPPFLAIRISLIGISLVSIIYAAIDLTQFYKPLIVIPFNTFYNVYKSIFLATLFTIVED